MAEKLINAKHLERHIEDMRLREDLIRQEIIKLRTEADTLLQERIRMMKAFKPQLDD